MVTAVSGQTRAKDFVIGVVELEKASLWVDVVPCYVPGQVRPRLAVQVIGLKDQGAVNSLGDLPCLRSAIFILN